MSTLFNAMVGQATTEAWAMLWPSMFAPWLYYTPSDGPIPGQLVIVAAGEEPPAGARLACEQRIPMNLTREGLAAWILDRAKRLPILPTE